MSILGPAPRPCESCPYGKGVPSGVWSLEEYKKLRDYDADTSSQPFAVFQCHQNNLGDNRSRMCAGWVGCHGDQLLALRLHVASGGDPSVLDYETSVPLFSSGAEAADHGEREINSPSPLAIRMIKKIARIRDLPTGDGDGDV